MKPQSGKVPCYGLGWEVVACRTPQQNSQKYVTEALSTPVIKNQKRSQQGCSHQSQLCLISQAWSDDTDGG